MDPHTLSCANCLHWHKKCNKDPNGCASCKYRKIKCGGPRFSTKKRGRPFGTKHQKRLKRITPTPPSTPIMEFDFELEFISDLEMFDGKKVKYDSMDP